ncbi:SDR family oxidoreductase [Umezawaea beigongshangensis]|uniref:SDR family oxidoreductase n=1 Tax=Umezawaea beigongshangensis TaxID=2780383 RepID=UPI0018F26261|nr:NAD(P)H-binding protein [Umezawaea beigongshangensis]
MRVAVAGGTGLTGKRVVESLVEAGHEPVVLSRGSGVDLVSGSGLDDALTGVETVVDVSNVTTTRAAVSVAFFEAATRHLLAAAERAGVRHHVVLSIVGCDRVDLGYYEGKRRQEELVRAGAVPWTVLRTTQFHEFAGQVLDRVPPGPVALVPRMLSQPVAVREVAQALVALVDGVPLGAAPELAGPRPEQLVDQVRLLLRARGQRRWVLPVRLPGETARRTAGGALLPTAGGPRGTTTFAQWLEQHAAV